MDYSLHLVSQLPSIQKKKRPDLLTPELRHWFAFNGTGLVSITAERMGHDLVEFGFKVHRGMAAERAG